MLIFSLGIVTCGRTVLICLFIGIFDRLLQSVKFALHSAKSELSVNDVEVSASHPHTASTATVHAATGARRLPARSSLRKTPGPAATSDELSQESASEKELRKFGDSIGFGSEGQDQAEEDESDSEESGSDMMSARPMAADLKLPKVILSLLSSISYFCD